MTKIPLMSRLMFVSFVILAASGASATGPTCAALTAGTADTSGEIVRLENLLSQITIGQPKFVRGVVLALVAGGHVIVRGPPGTSKSLLAASLGTAIGGTYKRIQFTPDMLPSDVIGSDVRKADGNIDFVPGPIFANIVQADEINRTPPKVQSAFLEAMADKQVSARGVTRAVPKEHFVIATENPQDSQGVFPLPEAQLDRFMFMIDVDQANFETELRIVDHNHRRRVQELLGTFKPLSLNALTAAREEIEKVEVPQKILRYIVHLVHASRPRSPHFLTKYRDDIVMGAGTRAVQDMIAASKAVTWMDKRKEVTPTDVESILPEVLIHRIQLSALAVEKQITVEEVIEDLKRAARGELEQ